MARAIRIVNLREGDSSELERLVCSRTTEQRVVERARIVLATSVDQLNVRMSTLPTLHGEKMVLRLLEMGGGGHDLARSNGPRDTPSV